MNSFAHTSTLLHASALLLGLAGIWSSCASTIPREYIDQSEPGVTLTSLVSDPDRYRGKVVMLGGVIVEEQDAGEEVLLRLRNRPLDKDYVPHRPSSHDSLEAGHYWIMIHRHDLPGQYREWARVTIVGQVAGRQPPVVDRSSEREPLLKALYLRGWGDSVMNDGKSKATFDRNYTISVPRGARGEFGGQ